MQPGRRSRRPALWRKETVMRKLQVLLAGVVTGGLLVVAGSRPAPAQDPAVVNAKTAKVTFENNRVRVLDAVLQPGDKEAMHSHPAYVTYVVAGSKIRNHLADGKVVEAELKTGDVLYREPLTHWAENIGTTPLHVVLVELKSTN
jgi:quercetin dioxygenase-like cupin family protein